MSAGTERLHDLTALLVILGDDIDMPSAVTVIAELVQEIRMLKRRLAGYEEGRAEGDWEGGG